MTKISFHIGCYSMLCQYMLDIVLRFWDTENKIMKILKLAFMSIYLEFDIKSYRKRLIVSRSVVISLVITKP